MYEYFVASTCVALSYTWDSVFTILVCIICQLYGCERISDRNMKHMQNVKPRCIISEAVYIIKFYTTLCSVLSSSISVNIGLHILMDIPYERMSWQSMFASLC